MSISEILGLAAALEQWRETCYGTYGDIPVVVVQRERHLKVVQESCK